MDYESIFISIKKITVFQMMPVEFVVGSHLALRVIVRTCSKLLTSWGYKEIDNFLAFPTFRPMVFEFAQTMQK